MKRNSLHLLLLTCMLGAVVQTALARPITIDFSFHDYSSDTDVSGYIVGLEDNGNSQAATSVFVTSNSGGYGIGEYVGNPLTNTWYVSNGVVNYVDFRSNGISNTAPDVTCCVLEFFDFFGTGTSYTVAGLSDDPSAPSFPNNNGVTFTQRGTVAPVPVMSFQAIVLLALSMAVVGILLSRRREKVSGLL